MALSLFWHEMTFQKNTLETLIVTEHKCNYMVLPVRKKKYTVLQPLWQVKQNRTSPGCQALTSNFRLGFSIVGYLFLPWVKPGFAFTY